MYEYIPIDFKNFKPTIGFQRLASEVMGKLHRSVPQYSSIKVYFEKRGDLYTGYAAIDTNKRTYVAYTVDGNIYGALRKLEMQINSQLEGRKGDFYERPYRRSG